jgi:hypothetical protein
MTKVEHFLPREATDADRDPVAETTTSTTKIYSVASRVDSATSSVEFSIVVEVGQVVDRSSLGEAKTLRLR